MATKTLRPTQRPTATGIHVRSTRDANVLFHAVACGILPMVTCRLDAADRAALAPGCVYIWEERSPAADATGAGMERFTEGRHWHPSRVRDDFLLYVEKNWDTNDLGMPRHSTYFQHASPSAYSTTSFSLPRFPTRRGPLIKQTYSVLVNNGSDGMKKWHLNAYYSEDALKDLLTVNDIAALSALAVFVPHEFYRRARAGPSASSSASSKRESETEKVRRHVWAERRRGQSPQCPQSDHDADHLNHNERQSCLYKSRYASYSAFTATYTDNPRIPREEQWRHSSASPVHHTAELSRAHNSETHHPHCCSHPHIYQSQISHQCASPQSERGDSSSSSWPSASPVSSACIPSSPCTLSPVSPRNYCESPLSIASHNICAKPLHNDTRSPVPQLAPLAELLRSQAPGRSDLYCPESVVTGPDTVTMNYTKVPRREPEDERLLRSFRPL